MIVSCPNCATRFNIDRASLAGGGRKVRCGRCGHKWLVEDPMAPPPPAPEPDPFPVEEDPFPDAFADTGDNGGIDFDEYEDAAAPQRARFYADDAVEDDEDSDRPAPSSPRKRIIRAVIGLVVVFGLVAAAAVFLSRGMLDVVGGLTDFGASLDGESAPAGPVIGDGAPVIDVAQTRIRVTTLEREGQPVQVFEVTGLIRNAEEEGVRVPPMQGAFQDANGAQLYVDDAQTQPAVWRFNAPTPVLEPGETARFRTVVDVSTAPANAQNIEISFVE